MDLTESIDLDNKPTQVFNSAADFANHIANATAADAKALEEIATSPQTFTNEALKIKGLKSLKHGQ